MRLLIFSSFGRNWKISPTGRHTNLVSFFQDHGLPTAADSASDHQSSFLFPLVLM